MKNLFIFILLLCTTIYSQNIYFSEPLSTKTYYINQDGEGYIRYNFYHHPSIHVYKYWARLTYPDGSQSKWQTEYKGSGEIGAWTITKAGKYCIEGKASVRSIFWGSAYTAYRDKFCFRVVDNYAPSVPSGINVTTSEDGFVMELHPLITWNANSEKDFSHYIIERRIGTFPWEILDDKLDDNSFEDYELFYTEYMWVGETFYRVKAIDINGNVSDYSNIVTIDYTDEEFAKKQITSCNQLNSKNYSIRNYPNPFNPTTKISYNIPKAGYVSLKVFDTLGQEVANLVDEFKNPGQYNVNFNALNLSSGIYIVTIKVNDFYKSNKILLTK